MSPFDSPNLSFTNRPYVAQLKLLPRSHHSHATIPICSTGFTRVVKWHYMLPSVLACNTNLYTMWCKLTKFSDVTWPQTVWLWATLNSDDFTYVHTFISGTVFSQQKALMSAKCMLSTSSATQSSAYKQRRTAFGFLEEKNGWQSIKSRKDC